MMNTSLDRRAFLRRSGAVALTGVAGPWAMNLTGLAHAAASQAPNDYKAVVCVFLQGGNDHANTLIPYDPASYALYKAARGSLAIPWAQLQPTALAPTSPAGRQLALAPALAPLKPLFEAGRLAPLLNIGPLHGPTTRDDFERNRSLPPKLFSHNDQQAVWQSSTPEGALTGWGGLMAEQGLPAPADRQPRDNLACINLSGNAVFLNGETTGQYMVSPLGIAPLKTTAGAHFGVPNLGDAFNALSMNLAPDAHWLSQQHASVMRRARDTNVLLQQALQTPAIVLPAMPEIQSGKDYEQRHLAFQLHMVARLIEARQRLGLKRQVFFVSLGGFDHHDNLSALHGPLLARVGQALFDFQVILEGLGVARQVTTFTASDFGRTMTSNGDGSDHGWGSYHFVMGGAVRGGRFYGELPDVVGGATDIGQGRLLPTMAVDHLSAALSRWMGITDAATLSRVAPHLAAWGTHNPLAGLLDSA